MNRFSITLLSRSHKVLSKRITVNHTVVSSRFSSSETERISPLLPGLSQQQIEKIATVDKKLRNQHLVLEASLSKEDKDTARRKRMIYRSKQRGWLEADILLGSWASKYVNSLSEEDLDDYELLLNEETIDIYNYVSGKDPTPPHLVNLPVMKRLQEYAMNVKLTEPADYADIKKSHNLT